MASMSLFVILQRQTQQQVNISELKFQGASGISPEERRVSIEAFILPLKAGPNPDTMRIKGYEKPGRRYLGGGFGLESAGNPGKIIPSAEGGLSALEFTEMNALPASTLIPGKIEDLPKLALCAWKALSAFLREDTGGDALPAAIVSIQTAGEFLNWHPDLHVLVPAGAFRHRGCAASGALDGRGPAATRSRTTDRSKRAEGHTIPCQA